MTDEITGAASGAAASDQADKASAGVTSSAPAGAGEQEETTLTLTQAKALIAESEQRSIAASLQQSQRLVDKADSRITARYRAELGTVAQVVEAYKATGQEIPAAVLQNLRDQAMQRAVQGSSGQDPKGQQHQPGQAGAGQEEPAGGGVADAVVALAIQQQEKAGIWILDTDPEVAQIDRSGDAQKFLASIPVAIKAKALRLAGVTPESDDASEEEAEKKPEPGKGLQARGKGKPNIGVKEGLSPSERFDAAFREVAGK